MSVDHAWKHYQTAHINMVRCTATHGTSRCHLAYHYDVAAGDPIEARPAFESVGITPPPWVFETVGGRVKNHYAKKRQYAKARGLGI